MLAWNQQVISENVEIDVDWRILSPGRLVVADYNSELYDVQRIVLNLSLYRESRRVMDTSKHFARGTRVDKYTIRSQFTF